MYIMVHLSVTCIIGIVLYQGSPGETSDLLKHNQTQWYSVTQTSDVPLTGLRS